MPADKREHAAALPDVSTHQLINSSLFFLLKDQLELELSRTFISTCVYLCPALCLCGGGGVLE